MKSESLKWWLGVAVIIVIYLWIQNNALHKKVNGCGYNIIMLQNSIAEANIEIANAKDDAGKDYYTMNSSLNNLVGGYSQQLNPCSKYFAGSLDNYPKE